MSGREWAILIGTALVAGLGVFVAAGSDVTWADLRAPQYILGSALAMASAVVAFFSKSPRQ